jgi:hypothetical protein
MPSGSERAEGLGEGFQSGRGIRSQESCAVTSVEEIIPR